MIVTILPLTPKTTNASLWVEMLLGVEELQRTGSQAPEPVLGQTQVGIQKTYDFLMPKINYVPH